MTTQITGILFILLALNGLLVWKVINDLQNSFEQLKRINTSDFEVLLRLNTEVSINKVYFEQKCRILQSQIKQLSVKKKK